MRSETGRDPLMLQNSGPTSSENLRKNSEVKLHLPSLLAVLLETCLLKSKLKLSQLVKVSSM